jgi:hypothetical protein
MSAHAVRPDLKTVGATAPVSGPAAGATWSAHTLDPELVATANGQSGMLTTAQATHAGLSAPRLVALVKAGVLRHPGRGLYAVSALVDPTPEGWHRQLCAGAFLVYPDAVLAGTSAVLAHGIPVWGAPLTTPSIMRPVKRAGGMGAFWVRPSRGEPVATEWGPASMVPAALVQHAVTVGSCRAS